MGYAYDLCRHCQGHGCQLCGGRGLSRDPLWERNRPTSGQLFAGWIVSMCVVFWLILALSCAPLELTHEQKVGAVRAAASVAARELSPADQARVCAALELYQAGTVSSALLDEVPAPAQRAVRLALAYARTSGELGPWIDALVEGLSEACDP